MKKFAVLLRFFLFAVIVIGSVFTAYNSSLANQQEVSIVVKIKGIVTDNAEVFIKYTNSSDEFIEEKLIQQNSDDAGVKQYYLDKKLKNKPNSVYVLIKADGNEDEYTTREHGSGNPQGEGTLIYWVDQPVDPGTEEPGTENPDNPGTENPDDPGTENPENPGTENPDDPGTENPTDPGTENPDDPGTENPDDPGTENPDDPGTENPDDPGTENPDNPGTENPDDPGTENPDDPGTENPDDPGTENPDDPGTENPNDPGTENPENPGTENPENPGTENPENPGTQNPGTGNTPQQPGSSNVQQPATNTTGTVQTVTKTVSGGQLPDTAGPWMNWLILSGFLAVGSAATLFKFRKQ